MQKVYLVICDLGYDGDSHEGVFASREAAERWIEKKDARDVEKQYLTRDWEYVIEEWPVQE